MKGGSASSSEETTMAGAALFSTISQIQELGSIGEEVLARFGITEIDLNKRYSYKIRGAIHTELHKRYGDDVLFLLGYTQLDGYKKWIKTLKIPEHSIWAKKNRQRLDSTILKTARRARDNYLSLRFKVLFDGAKNSIFSKDGPIGGLYKKTAVDKIRIQLTNACLPQFEAFNRGNIVELLMRDIGAYWDFEIKWDPTQAKSGNGWATFVWNVEFKRKRTNKSSDTLANQERKRIHDRFIVKVLEYAEKQRLEAEKREEKVDELARQLARYIPPQIHSALMAGNYSTEVATRRKKLTIFFSDIKNFTSTSEGLQPEDLTKYLNEYFSEMTQIAIDQGATIDKYIGDAMMVFFGDPETKGEREDARACVEMALRMQERMRELQTKWSDGGFSEPFQVRMGINTGYCNVGNFGSDQRLTYTIIGGEVNVAARLESGADANGILMSYETYAHCQDLIKVEQREAIKMKGINRDIKIFSVLKRKNELENEAIMNGESFKKIKVENTASDLLEKRLEKVEKELVLLAEELTKLR